MPTPAHTDTRTHALFFCLFLTHTHTRANTPPKHTTRKKQTHTCKHTHTGEGSERHVPRRAGRRSISGFCCTNWVWWLHDGTPCAMITLTLIYTRTHTHARTQTHTHKWSDIYAHAHACAHTHAHKHTHINGQIYMHTRTRAHTHTHINACEWARAFSLSQHIWKPISLLPLRRSTWQKIFKHAIWGRVLPLSMTGYNGQSGCSQGESDVYFSGRWVHQCKSTQQTMIWFRFWITLDRRQIGSATEPIWRSGRQIGQRGEKEGKNPCTASDDHTVEIAPHIIFFISNVFVSDVKDVY